MSKEFVAVASAGRHAIDGDIHEICCVNRNCHLIGRSIANQFDRPSNQRQEDRGNRAIFECTNIQPGME